MYTGQQSARTPDFERPKTFHALDRRATVIGAFANPDIIIIIIIITTPVLN
jgi:hypothetical protein